MCSKGTGVLVLGHGSRYAQGLEVITETAARYQAAHPALVVRPAFVTQRIMPKTIGLGEGAWAQLNEDGDDIAGATNTLSSPIPTGQGHTGFNSNNCVIEKYTGELDPDCEWPQRVIFE